MRVLIRKFAVHLIISRHYAFRSTFLHRYFKAAKINFPKRAFVYDRIARHAAILAVIRRKMLHARRNPFTLDSAHVSRRHLSRQVRIFRKILEIPSAERISLDIQPRSQQHVYVQRSRFLAQRFADSFAQLLVPRTCHDRSRGKTRRGNGRIQS